MQTLSAILVVNSERLAILVVCLLSVGFLLWFLVALILDERKMRVRRRRPSRSHVQVQYRNIAGFDSQESGGAAGSGTKDAKANPQQDTGFRPPTGKHLEVVRLSDKEAGSSGETKLHWPVFALLLWGPLPPFSHA